MAISITTLPANNVTAFQAKLHGEYDIYGDTTFLHLLFIIGTPDISWGSNQDEIEPRVTPFEYPIVYPKSGDMKLLCPETYYEFKAWMQVYPHGSSPYEEYSGAVLNFTTDALIVETKAVGEKTLTSVKAHGTIAEDGYTHRGFEYYKDGDEGNKQYKYHSVYGGAGAYEVVIDGLLSYTKYYIRAHVTTDLWPASNIATGEWKEFITSLEASGKADITTEVTVRDIRDIIINKKATKLAGHLNLYGEIIDLNERTIIERGFEYLIQDAEPGKEDTGTEVKETGSGFGIGEYNLSSWDTFNDLYRAEENKIWWFRAYCKDDQENKFIADAWMKNVPSTTTFECTEVFAQEAKGNGELIDLGANIVTKRGFRIIKYYSGDLHGAHTYISDGFKGEIEMEKIYNANGILIGFKWTGELYRDSLHEDEGGYELGIYDKILGGGFLGEGFGLYLKSNDNLKVVAIAENQLGMGFGGEVDLNTGRFILPSDDEIVSEVSAEKTITLGTIPGGATVTRIGIRLGRTMGCNEIHVYEDGTWGSGGSVTFYITDFVPGATYYKMPYIIIDYGDYQEEILAIPDYRNPERLEEWLEDYPLEIFPEVEDEDDLDQIIIDTSVGDISYRTIIKEIKCERIGDQSFIDRYGRRRSQTISNHLIQSRANCIIIADDYVERFQILKLKIAIDYDIPIPFEREDVILLGDGKHKLREDGEGLIPCKDDGEGEVLQEDFILAKIRKMDSRFISGSETILSLELEV